VNPAGSSSPVDLSTEQLEGQLRRSDLPPEQRKIIEEELTRRLAAEFRGEPSEPAAAPYRKAPPPSEGSSQAPSAPPPPPSATQRTQPAGQAPSAPPPPPSATQRTQPAVSTVPNLGQTPAGRNSAGASVGKPTKHRSSARAWTLVVLVIAVVAGVGIAIAQSHHDNSGGGATEPTTVTSSNFDSSSYQPQTFTAYVLVPPGYIAISAYQSPSLDSPVYTLQNNQAVQIVCTAQGEEVSGNGRTSSLWDGTKYGFIPDVDLDTGTNQATMPDCYTG
jgi:hypothetical protein